MLVVTNTIKIKEGHGEALASRFSADNGVQSIPGFIRMEVWRGAPKEGIEELKISTVWENEEALNGWTSSPAFRDSHRGAAGTKPLSAPRSTSTSWCTAALRTFRLNSSTSDLNMLRITLTNGLLRGYLTPIRCKG